MRAEKCTHTYTTPCFRVFCVKDGKTFHMMDEGSAVMLAMRHSRDQGVTANVIGPDGQIICSFTQRTYDIKAVLKAWMEVQERTAVAGDIFYQINREAAKRRKASIDKHFNPAKKEVSTKRLPKKALPKKAVHGTKPLRKTRKV